MRTSSRIGTGRISATSYGGNGSRAGCATPLMVQRAPACAARQRVGSVGVVDEPPARLAHAKLAVPLLVVPLARWHLNEAPVAHPIQHRRDDPFAPLPDALVTRLRARRELRLALGDTFRQPVSHVLRIHRNSRCRVFRTANVPSQRLQVLDLQQQLQLGVQHQTPFSSSSARNCFGSVSAIRRCGTSDSLLNWAILPSTGRYWLDTSSGGATMRKKKLTGFSSIARKSTPSFFRPKATRSLLTTRERQWGMAMPRPIPVDPRFSRRLSILLSMPSDLSSSLRSAI